jgi:hypothetical protein
VCPYSRHRMRHNINSHRGHKVHAVLAYLPVFACYPFLALAGWTAT